MTITLLRHLALLTRCERRKLLPLDRRPYAFLARLLWANRMLDLKNHVKKGNWLNQPAQQRPQSQLIPTILRTQPHLPPFPYHFLQQLPPATHQVLGRMKHGPNTSRSL